MYKEKVKDIVFSVYPVSENAFREIENLLELQTFSKGEVFISRDKPDKKEYFLLEGICKSYLLDPDGNEVTISFFPEKSILSPHSIRTAKNKSVLNFKALTDIALASVNAGEFEQLMIDKIEIRNFANRVLQNELISKVEKEIGLASLPAKERLIEFRKKFPVLENYVPHTDIASYLGITNISLSRLRKELMG